MKLWIDAQLSPSIAAWMTREFAISAMPIRDLGLRDAADFDIFFRARAESAVVMSKDADFVELLARHGPPPRILWVTCGNTSNPRLKEIIVAVWPQVEELLAAGESLVEITDAREHFRGATTEVMRSRSGL